MQINRIDHVVLTVRDVDRTCAFYARVLGVEIVTLGMGRRALQVGDQTIHLQELGREAELRAGQPTPGAAAFCLAVDEPLESVLEKLDARGVRLEEELGENAGPVYFRDPDGNLVGLLAQGITASDR